MTHRGAQACVDPKKNGRFDLEPHEFKVEIDKPNEKLYTEIIPRFVNEYADFWQPELNAIAVAVAVEVLARSSLIVMLFLLKFSLK